MTVKPKDTIGVRDNYSLSKATVDIVYNWFRTVERKTHQAVTPDMMIEAAGPEDSPLHGLFEWDDEAAAHQYRLEQARYYIRAIEVSLPDFGDQKVRAILSTEAGFISTRQAVDHRPDVVRMQLDRLHREAEQIAREYAAFEAIITRRPDADALPAAAFIHAASALAEA